MRNKYINTNMRLWERENYWIEPTCWSGIHLGITSSFPDYMVFQHYVLTQMSESGHYVLARTSWQGRPGQDFTSCLRRPRQDVLARTFMSYCTSAPS